MDLNERINQLVAEVELLQSVAEELRLKLDSAEENAAQQRAMKFKARTQRDALAGQVQILRSAIEKWQATDVSRFLQDALDLTFPLVLDTDQQPVKNGDTP